VSSNPAHDDVSSIQHYVVKFVSDLRQVSGFLWVLQFPLHMWWQQKSWKHNVYISFLGDFVYLYRTVVHTNSKIYIMFLLMFIFTRNTCKRLLTLTFVNCCLSVLLFYRGVSFLIIVCRWGQYEFLWTLKTIFTEAFRLRWILIF
jgi:hypothetical protein